VQQLNIVLRTMNSTFVSGSEGWMKLERRQYIKGFRTSRNNIQKRHDAIHWQCELRRAILGQRKFPVGLLAFSGRKEYMFAVLV
jgi:hypothetical protein